MSMVRCTFPIASLLVAGLIVTAPSWAAAQTTDPDPTRFAADIDAFRQWDAKHDVPRDGVLFVGSSSIRLWPTAERFPNLPVINRGFGGSYISDVNHYLQDVVLKYRPAVIVFYAGENDINAGKTPQDVSDAYRTFVLRVLEARRDTRIIFLSLKPSPSRWAVWPAMRETNERIRSYIEGFSTGASTGGPALFYLDVASPLLAADGRPQPHLYVDDNLHLSEAGYDIWTRLVADAITRTEMVR